MNIYVIGFGQKKCFAPFFAQSKDSYAEEQSEYEEHEHQYFSVGSQIYSFSLGRTYLVFNDYYFRRL